MAQFEPFGSRRGILAGSFSIEGVAGSEAEVEDDIAEGFAEDPEAEAEVGAGVVLAFWAGPITCRKYE
jgi:hypothetical protein